MIQKKGQSKFPVAEQETATCVESPDSTQPTPKHESKIVPKKIKQKIRIANYHQASYKTVR